MPTGRFVNQVGTPASPQFARIVLEGIVTESNASIRADFNVFDLATVAPAVGGDLTLLVDAFDSAITSALVACKSDSYTLVRLVGQFMDDPTSGKVFQTSGSTGTITTDRSASFNAGVIRKLTGLTGRSYRGSTHVGALPEAFTTKDQLNATGQTAYNALVTAMGTLLSGISDGTNLFTPIVLSSIQSNLIANPSIFTGAWVTSFALNLRIGTMKRRKERGAA